MEIGGLLHELTPQLVVQSREETNDGKVQGSRAINDEEYQGAGTGSYRRSRGGRAALRRW